MTDFEKYFVSKDYGGYSTCIHDGSLKNPCTTACVAEAQTTSDKVWIPSYHEVRLGNMEGEGNDVMRYSPSVFPDSASRIRNNVSWWLRTAVSTNATVFYVIGNSGGYSNTSAINTYGVCPCFCI